MPDSRFKCLWTYKIHHQAKYQRLNANTLYVAAILFSRSTLHREALPCLPNMMMMIQDHDDPVHIEEDQGWGVSRSHEAF